MSSQELVNIVYDASQERSWISPPGCNDFWIRIRILMLYAADLSKDEERVQIQQHGMIRDGFFVMPSIYSDRESDQCNRSWFHEYRFYYEFETNSQDRYFWITGQLDCGYSLQTIWFPEKKIVFTNYYLGVDVNRLIRFKTHLQESVQKIFHTEHLNNVPRLAIVGYQHMLHTLWNELPALDLLSETELPSCFKIAVQHEPFGPIRRLFPELSASIYAIRYEDIPHQNSVRGLVFGLGSWTITHSTQKRILDLAEEISSKEVILRIKLFEHTHSPIFWISVKPPQRTISEQPQALAALITHLKASFPAAGFIINGVSFPWDFPINTNYPPWFHDYITTALDKSKEIIECLLRHLQNNNFNDIVILNGISACEEAAWGKVASFYICHGGSMQNKIGWLHDTPGFIHSNRPFIEANRSMPVPVFDGPACYYASDELIVDDDQSKYSTHEITRKDQNYSFSSLSRFIDEVTCAIRKSGL